MAVQGELFGNYRQDIHDRGYASAPFSLSDTEMSAAFENFGALCDEVFAKETQHGLHIVRSLAGVVAGRESDSRRFIESRVAGQVSLYEERAPATETKDTFHYTPQTVIGAERYYDEQGITMPSVLRSMLDHCVTIHEAVKRDVRPALDTFGLTGHLISPVGHEDDDIHILRFLRYPAIAKIARIPKLHVVTQRRDNLAELHLDRGVLTAAPGESGPGLVGAPGINTVGNPNLTLAELDAIAEEALAHPIQHRPGWLKLFLGAKFYHIPAPIRPEISQKPTLMHGVTGVNPEEERFAAVVFFNQRQHIRWQTPGEHETGFSSIRERILATQQTQTAHALENIA